LQASGAKPLIALAGIAQPEIFFNMLRDIGLTLTDTMALPDHYDFDSCSRSIHKDYQIICTEKDAIKLWKHAPDALAVPLIQTAEPAFIDAIDVYITQHLTATLSSEHGHKTT
jgi:tetraacyldisaccharide 4'-kinase